MAHWKGETQVWSSGELSGKEVKICFTQSLVDQSFFPLGDSLVSPHHSMNCSSTIQSAAPLYLDTFWRQAGQWGKGCGEKKQRGAPFTEQVLIAPLQWSVQPCFASTKVLVPGPPSPAYPPKRTLITSRQMLPGSEHNDKPMSISGFCTYISQIVKSFRKYLLS